MRSAMERRYVIARERSERRRVTSAVKRDSKNKFVGVFDS